MSKLNTQWMASVLAQVIANTAQGVPTFVGEHPEIMALKEAGFIKIDKRKKGEEEGTFASVATETATMDAFHAAFPADAAPAPQVAPQSAEVDTAAQLAADQAAQLAATAQPQFTDAPAPQAAPAPAPVEKKVEEIRRDIFFTIYSNKISEKENKKILEVIDFLVKYPEAKVVVTGYADKGTGNDRVNDRIAAKRAAAVVWMLEKRYGIPAERITEESKGARVQPFAENNMNRVSIMIAK